KVLMWRFNWKKHDYKKPHMHFGPLAVAPDYQGKGIGSALLGFFCDQMDASGQVAYLETDKEINLRLYERCGFKTVEEDRIFGVKNWFMVRYPNGHEPEPALR
ncbi:MAG TPA: GNAT family N-acetyltransferase, partial [Sphingobacteriaceae bacterium]